MARAVARRLEEGGAKVVWTRHDANRAVTEEERFVRAEMGHAHVYLALEAVGAVGDGVEIEFPSGRSKLTVDVPKAEALAAHAIAATRARASESVARNLAEGYKRVAQLKVVRARPDRSDTLLNRLSTPIAVNTKFGVTRSGSPLLDARV